jgi:prepilin-type N-terminal cleavage/methylation domain-containing protein
MRRPNGFTMVELLVVMAVIAILMSIATIAYLAALDRTRLKRTVADMRSIALAWEARAADNNTYTAAGYDFPTASAIEYKDFRLLLQPTYMRTVPQYDSWGRRFEFAATNDPKAYAIRAAGRDGQFDDPATYTPGETSDPDCDIVYANGLFVQYPGVAQAK